MRLLLTHAGYEVRTAERAEDALQMLSSYRPELILADIQLPGMNGLEMTRRVKEDPRTSAIRVVALTACAMKEDRERALHAGCDDYISKPIDTTALAARVRDLLARPAAALPAPPEAQPPAEIAVNVSGMEIDDLRHHFLEEGTAFSRQFLESLNCGFDPVATAWQLHKWVGSAGLLGHLEISALARKGEELLRAESLDTEQLRVILSDLLLTFTDLREKEPAAVPNYIIEAISGKRVALIGFDAERADAFCTLLERAKARPRLFDATDDPAGEPIRDCDLVLFHVRPETIASSWLRPDGAIRASVKLLLTGQQRDLMALPAQSRSRAMDFIVGDSEDEEMLMRIASALSREPARVPVAGPVPVPAAEAPVRPRMATATPRIVLADDDGIVRSLVGASLQNYGMSCLSVDNGLDALSLIRKEQPHAAVLDVNMPGMEGFEVLAAIRAEKIPTRVILLTSLGQERDILRAFNLGADDYVTKPFNPFELVARLKRLLQ